MKIYLHTDIEGVAGWVFYAQRDLDRGANREHTRRMNALLTGEVVAACEAALDAGAREVYVNDAHGPCHSVDFERLPPGCRILHGRPGHFDAWLAQLDEAFDAMICLGQHAMAGTPHSVCPHSLWHVNGNLQLSETTMAAALAGTRGVPTILVTGDDKICAEAKEKIPGVHVVAVKKGIGAQNACSLAPAEARQRIAEAVAAAMKDIAQATPFTIPGPYRLNISDRNPNERVLERDVEGTDLWDAFHRAVNSTPYGHFGEDPLDDHGFRWP